MHIITSPSKQKHQGKYRAIPIHAKRARCLMVHYVIGNRISEPLRLRDFCEDGYVFCAAESTEKEWLFCREI